MSKAQDEATLLAALLSIFAKDGAYAMDQALQRAKAKADDVIWQSNKH